MSKTFTARLLGAIALAALVASTHVSAANCSADAEVISSWVTDAGFKLFAKVRVAPGECRGSCSGAVYGRFFYTRSDGWSHTATAMTTWRVSEQHRGTEVVLDTNAINCSKEKPCTVNDVQVTLTTCR